MRYIVSKKVLVVSPQSHQSESEDLVLEPTGPKKLVYKTYLRRTQAGPSRRVKEEQERISPNHIWAFFLSLYIQNQQMSVPRDQGTTTEVQPIFCNKLEWPSQNLRGLLVLFCWSSVLLPLATNGHCFSMPVGPLPLVAVGLADRWPKQIFAGSFQLLTRLFGCI